MAGAKFDLSKLKNIKLTKEQQQYLVVGVLVAGVGVYSYWNFIIKPVGAQIATLEKELKEKQDNLEKAKWIKDHWEGYNQRLARVQTASQYVGRRLPPRADFNVVVSRMIKMTLEGGVLFGGYAEQKSGPDAKSEFDGYEKKVSALILAGDYHKLGEFLSRLSGEDLVYNVEQLAMTGAPYETQQKTGLSSAIAMKITSYAELGGPK